MLTETLNREAAEQIFEPESIVGIEQYKASIVDAVNGIDDIWILRELYKMILHVTEVED